MEAAFRHRLSQVYQEVRRRLDYQVSVQGVYKRLERDQAINYIIGEVNKSIGPNLVIFKNFLHWKYFYVRSKCMIFIFVLKEKESFQSGLNTLKLLSIKHAGTI